jgi:hypothetical protein
MAKFVYVQGFGKFKAGDVVDVPDGAKAPSAFLVPAAPDSAPVEKKPDDVAAAEAELAKAQADLKAAEGSN